MPKPGTVVSTAEERNMPRTDIFSIRLDPNLRARLELVAAEDGVSPSDLVRGMIEDHIGDRHREIGRYSRLLARVTPPRADAGADVSASNSKRTTRAELLLTG